MKLKKNIAISETGFLFNPTTGDSFSVNPIGQVILKMLKEGLNPEEIKSDFIKDYMVDEDTFEKDFYDFTVMLKNFKLSDENNKA